MSEDDSASELVVRPGDRADVVALARLRHRWRAVERGEAGLALGPFEAALAEWMAAHRGSHVPFLAELAGEPVGMAWLAVVDRVPGPERLVRRAAYLQSVYVVPEVRGRGVGTALLEVLLAEADRRELDYLAVHPSAPSFSLYRRLGFSENDRVLERRPK